MQKYKELEIGQKLCNYMQKKMQICMSIFSFTCTPHFADSDGPDPGRDSESQDSGRTRSSSLKFCTRYLQDHVVANFPL